MTSKDIWVTAIFEMGNGGLKKLSNLPKVQYMAELNLDRGLPGCNPVFYLIPYLLISVPPLDLSSAFETLNLPPFSATVCTPTPPYLHWWLASRPSRKLTISPF